MITEPCIETLIDREDTTELLLRQIAGILLHECNGLSERSGGKPDYDIRFFVENNSPWIVQTDEDDRSPLPAVNIMFDHYDTEGDDGTKVRLRRGTFFIDCYASGNFDGAESHGSAAALNSLRLARIVRSVLESSFYRYLGLRGAVTDRRIKSMISGRGKWDSAVQVACQRIELIVSYFEDAPQIAGSSLDFLNMIMIDAYGEVFMKLNHELDD